MIGNSAYASAPLRNPVNDADAMARLLEQRNFKVTLLKDADLRRMEAAVDVFGQSLVAGGVGLFFYAGHGMQIEGQNYLIPVGAVIANERDVKFNALNVGKVLGKMEDAGNRLNIVFLDACRDNPFARSFRTATTGLAQMDAPSGTLIAYATAPGKVAADGVDSQNSVYTRYLLEQLGVPGQEIGTALRTVRGKVIATTKKQQVPWESTSLTGAFYLTPIDMLDENLALSRAQLEHLRKLQAEQTQAAANLKKLEDEKNAEMARLDAEIARLRQQAQQPGQSGSSLDQIVALGRRRAAAAAELVAAQRKAEEERKQREAQIARVQAEARAKRKAEFEAAYAKYQEVMRFVEQGHLGPAEHLVAWQAICGDFGVRNPGDKPGTLAWNDADGTVQLASLVLFPSGSGGTTSVSPGSGQSRTVDLGSGVSLELVWIPPGSFTMGSPDNESGRNSDEGPQHKVTISKGFWMGKYEVTQRQYQQLVGSNPSYFKNAGQDAPVEQVSWNDAKAFCGKLQARLPADLRGLTVRLPTEAEWEYTCRAGTTTALYTGGLTIRGDNNGPELDAIAWYDGNSEVRYEGGYDSSGWPNKQYNHQRAGTQLVGRKQPNAWGLHDMLGNVWEWCEDGKRSYSSSAATDPEGSGSSRVLRGGSWHDYAWFCRSAYRSDFDPGDRYNYIGFRVVVR